jgi:hypothetical protein
VEEEYVVRFPGFRMPFRERDMRYSLEVPFRIFCVEIIIGEEIVELVIAHGGIHLVERGVEPTFEKMLGIRKKIRNSF